MLDPFKQNFWTTPELKDGPGISICLDDELIAEIMEIAKRLCPNEIRPLGGIALSPTLSSVLEKIKQCLDQQRGFVVVKGAHKLSSFEKKQLFFWAVGNLLGVPIFQNKKNELLYSIEDLGKSMAEGARYSKSKDSGSFHSDAPFNPLPPNYVGLFCHRPAKSGGESCLINMLGVYQHLKTAHPPILNILESPFYFDRRGEQLEGEPARIYEPLFSHQNGFRFRYLRDYIEQGHTLENRPLSDVEVQALNVLDSTMNLKEYQYTFLLGESDSLFFNNSFLAHGRQSFEDYDDTAKKRFYLRLWLNKA